MFGHLWTIPALSFHCPLSKWLCTGACTGQGQTRSLSPQEEEPAPNRFVLPSAHALSSSVTWTSTNLLSHCAATRSAKLSCPSLDGESLEKGQPPAESSPCQVCQANWFSSKTFGPLWAKRNHISSPFCSKGSEQKSPIWTRGHKVPPLVTYRTFGCGPRQQCCSSGSWWRISCEGSLSLLRYKCIGLSACSLQIFWRFCAWGGVYIPFHHTAAPQFTKSSRKPWKLAGL